MTLVGMKAVLMLTALILGKKKTPARAGLWGCNRDGGLVNSI